MSNETFTFTVEDSCPDKEETSKCLDHNALNVPEIYIKEEIDIKKEIYIEEEVLTYPNNDTENVTVNNIKSNNITIDHLNVCTKIKTENDDSNTSCHTENLFNKIEQMSPKCSTIFTENIFEIKTEKYCENTDVQSSIPIEDYPVKEEIDFEEEIPQHLVSHEREFKNPINIHTGENSYTCKICLESFILKSALKTHMLTHSSKRLHKCNICLKSFTHKGTLNRHIFSHTGYKPHKCNICLISFVRRSVLKNHILTHTGEKPHRCNICLKSFRAKGTLKRHIFTHTGNKPHKCDICLKSFILKSILKTHMLTHTGETHTNAISV